MQLLRNLKIGIKFIGGFSLIILFLSYFSINTYYKIEDITSIEEISQEKTNTAFYMAQKINDHLKWVNKLSNDVYNSNTITVELDPAKCSFGKWYYTYSTEDSDLLPLYKNLEGPHKNLHKHAHKLLTMIQEDRSKDELLYYYSENLPKAVGDIENAISEFSERLQEDAVESKEMNSAALLTLSNYTFYLTFSLIVVSIIITILMTFLISKPVKLISKVASKYTEGEKDITVNYYSKDEIGLLAEAINKMMKSTNVAMLESEEQKRNAENAFEEATKLKNISLSQEKYLSECTKKILLEMEKFSEGDLTVELSSDKDDDFSKLFAGFTKSVKNIKNIILKVTEAVQTTYSASTEIASQSDEMAAGTQEQSAQASEVAAAVEEMSSTILETTKNASLASEKSKHAGEIARNGGTVVNETVAGMIRIAEVVQQSAEIISELGSSSEEIGNIIQVIDDIADQTNLLALNAAIEAARAGEQGRGFAVVADEVRKLAERTTKATKEIAGMIKKIQKDTTNAVESINLGKIEVEKGKELAQRAGSSLKQIIEGTEEVVDVINQVAAASEEQSSASEQISKSIDGINGVTHQTASGVQQIAKAADDLNRLTQNLQEIISRFKVEENEAYRRKELALRYN